MKHSKRCSPHADRHESAHSTRLTRWSRCRRVGSTRAPSIAPGSETRNPAQTAHNCKRERTCTMREVCVNAHALVARCLPRGGNRSHATPLEHHTHLILRHALHAHGHANPILRAVGPAHCCPLHAKAMSVGQHGAEPAGPREGRGSHQHS
jgi:hypothetical protein